MAMPSSATNLPPAENQSEKAVPWLSSLPWTKLQSLMALIAAVLAAFLVGSIVLLAVGQNPLEAYGQLIQGVLGTAHGRADALVKATPLLLVALGIIVAFRCSMINIGAEGQLLMGALFTTFTVIQLQGLPGYLIITLGMLAGVVAGAVWGGIAGLLRARFGVNEILSTTMLNYVAVQLVNYLLRGPMIDPVQIEQGTLVAQSAPIPSESYLLRLMPPTRLHLGFLIALLLAGLTYFLLWRTTIGFRIRAVGAGKLACKFAGINVPLYSAIALAISGAFAGLAGAIEILGVHHRMMDGVSGGYGFSGIVVALFADLNPLGAILSSILFGGLLVGADKMQRTTQIPSTMVEILNGLVLLFVLARSVWTRRKARGKTSTVSGECEGEELDVRGTVGS
jgi:ABC-type uncharacterized transport system permease subunit